MAKKKRNDSITSSIGGTAVSGAKSTSSKPETMTNGTGQQQETNREMRRRAAHLGMDTSSRQEAAREKATRKRDQRRKEIEAKRRELQAKFPQARVPNIHLGKNVLIFIGLIIALITIILLISLFTRHIL